jgi:hypothetical protein
MKVRNLTSLALELQKPTVELEMAGSMSRLSEMGSGFV